jgi:hypothetical protein
LKLRYDDASEVIRYVCLMIAWYVQM